MYRRQDGESPMKKKLFSILCLLTASYCNAAEQEERSRKRSASPAAEQEEATKKRADVTALAPSLPDHFHVEFSYGIVLENVPKNVINHYNTLQNMLDDLGEDNNEIFFVPGCSKESFLDLDAYREKEQVDRSAYLATLNNAQILSLIKTADYLELNDAADAYTDLMHRALKTFTVEQLKEQINLFDREALQKALKRMQLAAIANTNIVKRNLEHESNLGEEKVIVLKDNFLWNIKISIQDLYDNQATKDLLAFMMDNGLVILDLENLFLTSLDGFQVLPNLETVQALLLSNNQLTTLDKTLLSHLPVLQNLSLHTNNLTTLLPNTFADLPLLQHLDLANNDVTAVDVAAFTNLQSLTWLNLNNNRLTTLHKSTFNHVPQLVELDLGSNVLTELDPLIFNTIPHLELLDLSDNELETVHPHTFAHLDSLQELELGGNLFTTINPTIFTHLQQLEKLNLSFNGITTLHPAVCSNLPCLLTLNLSGNHLQELHPTVFAGASQLQELNLSECHLTELDPAILFYVMNLVELNLSHNAFTQLHPSMVAHLPCLNRLDLCKNSIKKLDPALFAHIDEFKELDLRENPLEEGQEELLTAGLPECTVAFGELTEDGF